MSIIKDDDVETYTVKQAADLLGVSRQTIYNYGKEGKLETREYPYNSSTRVMVTQESVHKMLEEREAAANAVNGISLTDLAKKWNLKRHRLYNLIKTKGLPYEVDEDNFTHPTVVISEEVKQELKELLNDKSPYKHAKLDFSKPSLNIAMYQKFYDKDKNEARLIRIKVNGREYWGFNTQEGFLEYKKALNEGYTNAYTMSNAKAINSSYCQFKLLKYDPVSFNFLDFLYEQLGINNLYLENLNDSEMIVHVRETTISAKDLDSQVTKEWLNNNIIDGKVELEGNTITFESKKFIAIQLDIEKYDALKRIAEREDLSIHDFIEKTINSLIEKDKIN